MMLSTSSRARPRVAAVGYLHVVTRAQVGRPGNDGPFDLAKRVHRGQEASGTGFALAVLVPRQRLGGVEFVGGRVDAHPDWRGGIGEYCPDLKGLIGPQ